MGVYMLCCDQLRLWCAQQVVEDSQPAHFIPPSMWGPRVAAPVSLTVRPYSHVRPRLLATRDGGEEHSWVSTCLAVIS